MPIDALPLHPRAVFRKTESGLLELQQRSLRLSARERQVFILFDGVRTVGAIAEIVPMSELSRIIPTLQAQQLIADRDAVEAVPAPAPASTPVKDIPASLADLDSVLPDVKAFMSRTARECLGLLGADVVKRIEQVGDRIDLEAAIACWHMALHESRDGRRLAGPYLDQVRMALEGRAAVEEDALAIS